MRDIDVLSGEVIGAAVAVHRALGPGIFERVYRQCLVMELTDRGISVQSELPIPVQYKGRRFDIGYRIDVLVERQLVVELKAVAALHPAHKAQLLSYLRLGNYRAGLLLNFHVPLMKDGIVRVVN